MRWENLKGCTINSFTTTPESIRFETPNGPIVFEAEGDCCSYSWIDSVNDFDSFPGIVTEATSEEGPQDDVPSPTNYAQQPNVLAIYFYKLKTTSGYFDLTMYNDSNGYYGGSLSCSSENPLNGKPNDIN